MNVETNAVGVEIDMSGAPASLRVAAVQMQPELGNVDANLDNAAQLVRQAFSDGAKWVVLPELFTTGIAFDDCMLDGHRPLDGEPMRMLKELAVEGGAMVGGSYLAEFNGHVYNTFALASSDGQVFTHDKDFPSGPIEHAYYAGGEDAEFISLLQDAAVGAETQQPIPTRDQNNKEGVFSLPRMAAGVALCWEMIRHRTVQRLAGKIDVLLASSAWPIIDPDVGFPGMSREQVVELNSVLLAMLQDAPNRLARMLGVPVVHANLVGPQRATKLFDQPVEVLTRFCGESKVVNANGKTVACRSASEGEGLVVADLEFEKTSPEPARSDEFWIPELHPILKDLWYIQGRVGREYYLQTTYPHRSSQSQV